MAFIYEYESIFDHNPTPKELADFGYDTPEAVEECKKYTAQARRVDYRRLCFLFQARGQDEKVRAYLKKAKEDGFDDLFTLEHELAGGCLQHPQ